MVPVVAFILLLSMTLQIFAFTPNTNKEEVVYVNLNLDGSVDAIYVVNSFDLSADGKIIDYGDYTSFRQLTESGQIKMEKETISIDAAAGKIYYEGKMKKNSIPWAFNIRYFLDGKEYKGEDLAGKSGDLKVDIDVRENPNYSDGTDQGKENTFFKNLTLQVGLSFQAANTKDLVAQDGVIANAGKNKQVMFTVLPGKQSSFAVTAKVIDFEMEGITINGVPMTMDFDFEDDPEMMDEMNKLTDGVAELDDGAQDLRDGVKDLREGTEEFKDGTGDLKDGVVEMADGTKELRDNTDEFVDGVKELDEGVGDLRRGTSQLRSGVIELVDSLNGLATSVGAMSSGAGMIAGGLGQMSASGPALENGAKDIVNQLYLLSTSGNAILAGIHVDNYEALLDGLIGDIFIQTYNAVETASGVAIKNGVAMEVAGVLYDNLPEGVTKAAIDEQAVEIMTGIVHDYLAADPNYAGLQQLYGPGKFYDGIKQYTSGLIPLSGAMNELSGGIGQMATGLKEMDLSRLRSGALSLHSGVVDLKDGTGKLLDGAVELKDGIFKLDDGVIELKDGVLELFDGAIELHDGVIELHDGTIKMAEGTMEFRDKTADLEKTFKDKIKEKIDEMLGGTFKAKSFVSEKNTNIESVQFVMKTADIFIEEVEQAPLEPPKPLSFLDRLLNLFTFLRP